MRTSSFASLLLVSIGTVAACSSFGGNDTPNKGDPQPSDQDGGGGDGGGNNPVPGQEGTKGLTLTIDAVDPRMIVQNKDNEISFKLARVGSTTSSSITVTASGLPAETTAAPVTLPAGVNEGKLLVHPSATAPQGSFSFTVKAVDPAKDGASAEAPVTAFLRGAPGTLDTTFNGGEGALPISTTGGTFAIDSMDRIFTHGVGISRFDKDGKPSPGTLISAANGLTSD